MKCSDCDILLSRRLSEELGPADGETLAAHLQRCAACARRAAEYDRLKGDLRALSRLYGELEPGFEFEPAFEEGARRGVLAPVVKFTRVSLAAAAVIALMLLIREAGSPLPSAPDQTSPTVRDDWLARKYRTAPLAIPVRDVSKSALSGARLTPAILLPTSPSSTRSSIVRMKTPTMAISRRRASHVHELDLPQSNRGLGGPERDGGLGLG
jgi:anti-sigma factor RsiW